MAIAFTKYIDITSSVGGAEIVPQQELILRIITTNPLLPTGSLIEFTSAAAVGAYFGTSSEEYSRSVPYFSRVSKSGTRAKKISFVRWVDTDVAPMIFGSKLTSALSAFTAIEDGTLTLIIGGVTNTMTAMDFSGALSLAAVAAIIQAAIRTKTGVQWTGATVTYDATRGAFNFVGGDEVVATISSSSTGSGTDIRTLMGWSSSAIFSSGSLEQSITDMLESSTESSDNFGTFLFIPVLTLEQVVEAAEWNATQNVKFQYEVPVALDDAATWQAALVEMEGTCLTISEVVGEYPEQLPATAIAATDYNQVNAVQNMMYQQQDGLTPSVTDTQTSDTLDALRVNYYGQTQSAGANISFYQRGFLMGGATAPIDINTYANEQWLKASISASLINLLLAVGRVPANDQGRIQITGVIQSSISTALLNGTISVGKDLTANQKAFITEVTGDPDAWQQVQSIGYWLNCEIVSYTGPCLVTEYKAVYTLVYSKDDDIRKVEGVDNLI